MAFQPTAGNQDDNREALIARLIELLDFAALQPELTASARDVLEWIAELRGCALDADMSAAASAFAHAHAGADVGDIVAVREGVAWLKTLDALPLLTLLARWYRGPKGLADAPLPVILLAGENDRLALEALSEEWPEAHAAILAAAYDGGLSEEQYSARIARGES